MRAVIVNLAVAFVFDYAKHGQDWVQGSCASRYRQSPVDFEAFWENVPTQGDSLYYKYTSDETDFEVHNDGHVISVDLANKGIGSLTIDNSRYNILAINVHTPAEHLFDGKVYPMEVHLIHKRYDSDGLAIIALPFNAVPPPPSVPRTFMAGYVRPNQTDPGYNPFLEVLHEKEIPKVGETQNLYVHKWNLSAAIPGEYLKYYGSLTAPPCTEDVTWYVRREPLNASFQQIELLTAETESFTKFGNTRAAFSIGERVIKVVTAVDAEPVLSAPAIVPAAHQLVSPREAQAMKWGQEAVHVTLDSLRHMRDLDHRLHLGAEAAAENMAPKPPPFPDPSPQPLFDVNAVSQSIAATLEKQYSKDTKLLRGSLQPREAAKSIVDYTKEQVD